MNNDLFEATKVINNLKGHVYSVQTYTEWQRKKLTFV